MEGWIKLHRRFMDWEWFSRPEMVQLFLYFLLKANHEPAKWQGITINQGQFITSLGRISKETSLSLQVVRTCINRLKSTNEITVETTNRNTMITICNYAGYQDTKTEDNKAINIDPNNQTTNEQQSNNNQITTNKNEENNKNNKNEKKGDLQSSDCPNSNEDLKKEEKPKPKRKPRAKKETAVVDHEAELNKKAREAFEARYLRVCRSAYYWQGKDAGNMTRLLNALKHQREQKGLSNENNVEVIAALTFFLNTAVKDEWIVKNFSISVLFSKFNEIVARAQSEEKDRKKQIEETNYGSK